MINTGLIKKIIRAEVNAADWKKAPPAKKSRADSGAPTERQIAKSHSQPKRDKTT